MFENSRRHAGACLPHDFIDEEMIVKCDRPSITFRQTRCAVFVNMASLASSIYGGSAAPAEATSEEQKKNVKLPYFHRVLSAEESALLGDISPKPICPTAAADEATTSVSTSAKWNAANTWEERDVTEKAKEVLRASFEESFGLSDPALAAAKGYSLSIDTLENISGNANITHVRGKPRFFYDWTFDLIVDVSMISADTSKSYSCKLSVDDVVNDQLDDIELAINWTGVRPPNDQLAIIKELLTGKKTMKHTLKLKLQQFETELQKL